MEDGEAPAASMDDFPEGMKVNTSNAGGEVSMSLEETNRVREKLGLKPLRTGESDRTKARREAEETERAAREADAKDAETAALAAKIAAAKEKRTMEQRNRATKQLGEAADADDDDMMAWVNKSRKIEEKRRKEERKKAEELARKLAEQDDEAEESEGDEIYGGKDLAGMRVRHGLEDVAEGETMILTLKDSSILDDKLQGINEEDDELENVNVAQERKRQKAKKAATKRSDNPFGADDEDAGKKILSKYDEEDEDEGLTLDAAGAIDAAEEKRKADIKRRLAASLGGVSVNAVAETADVRKREMSEFMSAAEVAEEAAAKFNKPKKKRRKKLREKKFDISEIENDHLAQAAQEKQEAAAEPERARGRFRNDAGEEERKLMGFQNALNKAKIKTDERILAEMAGDVEDEDTELAMALERTKRLAERGVGARSDVDVARVAAARRATDAPDVGERGASGEGMVFNDVQEFVHGINVEDKRATRSEAAAAGDMPPVPPPPPGSGDMPPVPPPPPGSDVDGMPPVPPPPPSGVGAEEEHEDDEVNPLDGVQANPMGSGLAATLALLKETGKLHENDMWDGRTNDKKPLALMRVREAAEITGAEFEGHKFDFKLDRYDEFGRKMTPKEAFRELCHRFHGIEPGRAKKEKRLRAYQEEVKAKKMREGESVTGSVDKMKMAQKATAAPYVVLSGKIHAGQISDAVSKYATAGLEDDAGKETGKASPAPGGAKRGGGGGDGGGGNAMDPTTLPMLTGAEKVKFMMSKK
ncbi:predicted protein [Micromonas commoda]|uniref:SART-1 family protein n=1 Tax=Micromonas commoda (strain RCC299 / NOUM17 / CCMP2709) TaxID=296587 RepID=C1EI09_MICCC|nr:predicted protein [Micromonas commoda]ACO67601.1 predicted protein [Micromonas commoda]|eukprot:XP_002506343.1 predicted protein [Micromonas commoda]